MKQSIVLLFGVVLSVVFALQNRAIAAAIYWTDDTGYSSTSVNRSNLDGTGTQQLFAASQPLDVALDPVTQRLYVASWGYGIVRANADGSQVEAVATGVHPAGVAVDGSQGFVYWADNSSDKIQRANLDGTNITDLVTSNGQPSKIAIDKVHGKIYWDEQFPDRIRRANLDGSNVETVLSTSSEPRGLALDLNAGKVYWTSLTPPAICRANLNGTGIETLLQLTSLYAQPQGLALDVADGKMYWADYETGLNKTGKIQMANLDGSDVRDVLTGANPCGITLDLTPVPEPSTAVLLGIGGLFAFAWRRRLSRR